jgi:hypothetical protein
MYCTIRAARQVRKSPRIINVLPFGTRHKIAASDMNSS